MNTWERSHGDYVVTMAILDLLLALYKGNVAMDTDSVLACVVWMCEEVMVTCEGWRHRYKGSRECLSMLTFCESVCCVTPPTHSSQTTIVLCYGAT